MKLLSSTLCVLCASAVIMQAQVRPLGVVTSIDTAAKRITIKTDAGPEMTVLIQEAGGTPALPGTAFRRVAPGETNLQNAKEIAFTDVAAGDRVLVRGKVSEDQKSVAATMVIVMSKTDIARKLENDRAAWQRRGIGGIVASLNPAAKQVAITTRSAGGAKPVVISLGPNVLLRRYAQDSVKFADTKPSTFEELAVGDQVRALGEKSADGSAFTAEEIVSGSFRIVAATVVSVDPKENILKINDLETKKQLAVRVNADSNLRKLQPMMAQMLAMVITGQRGARAPGAGETPAVPGPGSMGMRPGGLGMGRAPDLQQMLERAPILTLADLKPGDAIILSATKGSISEATAITLVAGVEPLLTAPAQRQMVLGNWSLDMGGMGIP